MSLNWQGDQLQAKMLRAETLAVDATMQAAIISARENHGPGAHGGQRFESHTGELERATKVVQRARRVGSATVGRWGAQGVGYARRIELGFQGKDAAGRVYSAQPYPYLLPAAQAEYPKLAGRIKRALAHA